MFAPVILKRYMKKNLLILLTVLGVCSKATAQQKLCIAFYNQENLFDTIDDPLKNDNEFLPGAKKGWNTTRYNEKIEHMSRVIAAMNAANAPDILGVCEIENSAVLQDLTQSKNLKKSKYQFVHIEGPDERSIDNGLLFKSALFKVVAKQSIRVVLPDNPDAKTRDILLVKLETKNKAQLVVLVNHFPSRLGGEATSEPRRIAAASTLRNICDSLLAKNALENIVIMGDFNDEPTNKSLDSVLRAKANEYDLNNGNLFNAMYEMKQNNLGSHYYKGQFSTLDQIILSSSITNCNGTFCYQKSSADAFKENWMLETEGKYKGAPLRTFVGDKYMGGFSDHLPVYVYIELRKK